MEYVALLFLTMYAIGITIAFIVTLVKKITCQKRNEFLIKTIKNMKREELMRQSQNNGQPVYAPVQNQMYAPQPMPMQQPMMQPMAQPIQQVPVQQPVPQAPQKKESKFNPLSLVFGVGVLLLIISAAVFISATWATLMPVAKCILLFSVVAVVFGMSAILGKKLKLENASSAFYLLGSLLMPVAITGTYLSFELSRVPILLSLCSISLLITGFLGFKIYKANYHVGVSYFGFVWSVTFILTQILGYTDGLPIGFALATLVSAVVYFIKPNARFAGLLAEISMWVSIVDFIAALILMDKSSIGMTVAIAMIAVAFILMMKRRSYHAYVAPLVLSVGILRVAFKYMPLEKGSEFIIYSVAAFIAVAVFIAIFKLMKKDTPLAYACGVVIPMMLYAVASLNNGIDSIWLAAVSAIVSVATIFLVKTALEKDLYWIAIAIDVILLVISTEPTFLGGISLALFVLAIAYSIIRKRVTPSIAFGLLLFIGMIQSEKYMLEIPMCSVMTGIFAVLYAGIIFYDRFKKEGKTLIYNVTYHVSRIVLVLISCVPLAVLFAEFHIKNSFMQLIIIAVAAVYIVLGKLDRDNYVSAIPAIFMLIAINDICSKVNSIYDMDSIIFAIRLILIVVLCIAGRFICKTILSKRKIDYLTIVGFLLVFCEFNNEWLCLMLAAVFVLTFIGRIEKFNIKLNIVIASYLCALGLAMSNIPFPEVAELELRLLIILLVAALIYITIKIPRVSRLLWFFTVAVLIHFEMIAALFDGGLLQLSIIMISAFLIFLYAFIAKRKSWFILGLASITEAGLGFSLTYWESKLWWIYLLVEGTIIIALASVNEYKKRQAHEKGLEEKKVMLFSNWKW